MSIKSIIDVFFQYYPLFFKGLGVTLMFALIAVTFGTLLGALIAMIQMKNNKITTILCKLYLTVIRGTPLLLQLWIVYFFLPMAFPAMNQMPFNKEISVLLALIINSSAYVSEIIRGGIQAVDKGQTEAARSLGMSSKNCMRRIILPQAIKNILPSLGNEYIMMVKETSLASVIAVGEIMYVKVILANKFLFYQPLIIIAIIYLIVTLLLSYLVSLLEKRLAVSD